ncbi:hypothetical protein ALC62_13397 [Cyphomyrmex costatus]|uniref:Uncharacterized protein n=2 Tax=Cyphomyrmex costatus TaxID=456900 RepID=A0A195C501_9HYME|nr:hypothetical protein ALC62_13397 [Cyphomyrmex costatus]
MRNPALHSVGIATSPGGGEVFGSRAEEELRQWLETRLDALGINPVAHSRFVLSLLRRPDSALSPPEEAIELGRDIGRRIGCARLKAKLPTHGNGEQRQAVVQCLTNAADNKCGVDALIDELCIKLKELEGGSYDEREESEKFCDELKTNLEALTLRDNFALQYYAAFHKDFCTEVSFIKTSAQKDINFANSNNNKNYGINLHNINNIARNKTKMSINIESHRSEDKESFGFVKSMEREREKELDQLKLAQLKAKFDSLETLWNSAPGNAQDTSSIWAAPSLSIPSKPLWPTDPTRTIFTLPTSDNGYATDTSNQESIIDESPLIPWDIDLISIEDNADECSNKDKEDYNISWLDSFTDGPWCCKGIKTTFSTNTYWCCPKAPLSIDPSFFSASFKTPLEVSKESRSSLKVNSLPEPDEDLLTSARTHFRPIKDDGHWADGTTFPVNNTVERVAYRRSESGNLLYLPGGESPYMEYRENDTVALPASTNLTLKFRVRQCDKSVQTEPVRSPVKRRILSEQDNFHYSPVGAEDVILQEQEDIEKDSFALDQLSWIQSSVLPLYNDRKR